MKHFRDITSFHSIGKVLDGKPEHENDVVDLLNFLSQVVFCDQVAVSILGPKEITSGTIDVIEKLEALGIPEGFIYKYSYPDDDNRLIQRKRISQNLFQEWLHCFPELSVADKSNFPPGYYEMLDTTVDIFSETLLSDHPIYNYQSEIQESLKDDSISYMVGLILADDNLTKVIKHNFIQQKVKREQLYDFIAISRNKYNLLLSEDLKLAFTPTASRALKNHQTAYSFMESYREKLNKDPREEMKSLKLTGKEYKLSIPSALHLLLSKDSSSVSELIDRTLYAREKLSWYREEVLSNFNQLKFSDHIEDQIKLSNMMDNVFDDVAAILSMNNKCLAKGIFGHFSIDLSNFNGISSSGKALGALLTFARNKVLLNKHHDCFLLTQELINHMSKNDSEYKIAIQKLYLSLGGSLEHLLKNKST